MRRVGAAILLLAVACGGQTTTGVGSTGSGGGAAATGIAGSGGGGAASAASGSGGKASGKAGANPPAGAAGASGSTVGGMGVGGIGNEDLAACNDDRKYVDIGFKCPGQCTSDKPCDSGKVCCAAWCSRLSIGDPDVHKPTVYLIGCWEPRHCAPDGTYDQTSQAWKDHDGLSYDTPGP